MNIVTKLKETKILQNSSWLMILQVFNTIVPMITIPYVTRILGAKEYGVFSLALNWILYFQVIVEYGFGYIGARKVAISDTKELQETYSNIITSRIILLVFSFILLNCIYLISNLSITHYLCMLILYLMIVGTAFQLTWLFQGKQDMKFITLINATSRIISVLLIFLLIKNTQDVLLYCFLYSFTYIFSSIVGLSVAKKKYGLRIKLSKMSSTKRMFHEGWPLFISQAMSKIVSGFGLTILGAISSSNIVGIYSAIHKIPYTMALFFSPISQALFPYISIEFKRSKNLGIIKIKKYSTYLLPIFFLLSLIIIMFRDIIIKLLFGLEYVEFSDIIIPLSLWFVISVVNNFLGVQTLVASGYQKEYSFSFTCSAIISVLMNVVLGIKYSIYGVAWATLISEIALTVLLIFFVKIKFNGDKV